MNNYEYIIASLPDITTGWKFGEKTPEDYIEEIVSLCSEKDRETIAFLMDGYNDEKLDAAFYSVALVHKDAFIREFFRFDLNVRNAKVKYLNKALGRPADKDVLTFGEDTDPKILEAVASEFEEAVARWFRLDEQTGREMFQKLVNEVRGTFKGVEYNG